MGMINYLGKFVPNISKQTNLMRQLERKDTIWEWSPNHEKEFIDLKNMLISAPILRHFDPKKELLIQCDASQSGLGAVLL